MSEFQPITTLQDLNCQEDDQIVAGYMAGLRGEPEPGSDKCRGYWHGWRNGSVDGKHRQIDAAQSRLARAIVGTYRGLN